MPSVSKKQHNLMAMVAHDPKAAKRVGIPQSVGKDFTMADKKTKKFFLGGATAGSTAPPTQIQGGGTAPALPWTNSQMLGTAGPSTSPVGGSAPPPGMGHPMVGMGHPGMGHPMVGMGHLGMNRFKKGGSVMKESKSMAAAEMKALKKGDAPKEVLAHERKEHKEMGYKHGGNVHGYKSKSPAHVTKAEVKQKPFGMTETSGGRKEPHSKKKGLEGDTHLKGFGMGKGQGHGRSVTRAKAPKEEIKQKGFAMKKGGHVKHHAKGGKAGGSHKPKRAGGIDPAALAAMMGPAAGGGGPMGAGPAGMPPAPGGAPMAGMKHGGHVIQHHHHYAHGGDVRHEDGAAERGHTKGRQVKMASGGHVGSHPHRRGDGCASKGHTRCRNV